MIQIPSINPRTGLWLLLLSGMALPVLAQQTRLDWPRTFTGQPDFEFTRSDIIKDATESATRQGQPVPTPPTLEDLLDDVELTPLDAPVIASPAGTEEVQDATADAATTKAARGNILPLLQAEREVDMSEFKTMLHAALKQQVDAYHIDPVRTDTSYLLRNLILQTVVTSPIQYAMINGKRYSVGETLQVPLSLGPSDVEQLALLETLMPPPESMTPSLYAQYEEAKEQVVATLASRKQSQPTVYQKTFTLPVTLVGVAPRKVQVQFQGQRYELALPYRY
ncbi:MAG: hypothetical protein COY40_01275 [Alphaproteobacteria bacterium CG_4_10_14_0_8_um_filter_53_9]|nr:MAG: hypothetical protein COY40_01275 [Alphaproteobacteria bacterium CG_4_10_14_0_8_um_filter_53_9]